MMNMCLNLKSTRMTLYYVYLYCSALLFLNYCTIACGETVSESACGDCCNDDSIDGVLPDFDKKECKDNGCDDSSCDDYEDDIERLSCLIGSKFLLEGRIENVNGAALRCEENVPERGTLLIEQADNNNNNNEVQVAVEANEAVIVIVILIVTLTLFGLTYLAFKEYRKKRKSSDVSQGTDTLANQGHGKSTQGSNVWKHLSLLNTSLLPGYKSRSNLESGNITSSQTPIPPQSVIQNGQTTKTHDELHTKRGVNGTSSGWNRLSFLNTSLLPGYRNRSLYKSNNTESDSSRRSATPNRTPNPSFHAEDLNECKDHQQSQLAPEHPQMNKLHKKSFLLSRFSVLVDHLEYKKKSREIAADLNVPSSVVNRNPGPYVNRKIEKRPSSDSDAVSIIQLDEIDEMI